VTLPTNGIHHLAIRVTDLDRAKRFYHGALGFPVVFEHEGVFIFDANGTVVGVRGADAQTAPDDRFSPFRVGLDHLALGVPDMATLEDLKRRLDEAGVPNNGVEPDRVLGGMYISFHDPDGIAWELYSPPSR
jgi:glyoxylase I family protein